MLTPTTGLPTAKAPAAPGNPDHLSTRAAGRLIRSRPDALPLLGLVVLAGALRFSTLSLQSFDLDESVTVALLHQGFHATLTTIPRTEKTPPLYYVLVWLWSRVFGLTETGLRSFSALAGTLTIPLVYVAGKRLISRRAGLIAAGLAAISPFLIWYSQEARSYALLVLLTAGSFALFVRLLSEPKGRLLAAWALVSALALATHYFAVFVLAPEALLLLWRLRQRGNVMPAAVAVGVVGLVLLPLAVRQASHLHGKEGFLATPLDSRIKSIPVQFLLGPEVPSAVKMALVAVGGGLALAGLLLLSVYSDRPHLSNVALACAVGASAVLVPLLLALAGVDYLNPRNLIGAWVPLIVVLAAGLSAPGAGTWGLLVAAALATISLAMVMAVDADQNLQRTDYRQAAETINDEPGSQVIVVTPPYNWTPLTHYLPTAPAMRADTATVRDVVLLGWRSERLAGATARSLEAHGFRLVEKRTLQKLALVIFRANRTTLLSRHQLVSYKLGFGDPTVLIR